MSLKYDRLTIIAHSIIQSTAAIMWFYHYLTNPLSQHMCQTLNSNLPIELRIFYGILPPLAYILTPISIIDSIADIVTNDYHYLPKRIYYSLKRKTNKDD